MLENAGKMHADFVVELTRSLASLEFSAPKVTNLGDDIYRIEVKVFNTGAMPVYPEIADKIKHVSKMKSIMELQKKSILPEWQEVATIPNTTGRCIKHVLLVSKRERQNKTHRRMPNSRRKKH
ncbi:hypothetical protein [Sphingobacterium daejeonense]|uniref:hypothetical protein n=1 Tax=Sphingobacterium daejeonense TaxID=371142 RepID=UPI0010C3D0D3|nr:hypothetical protein [Sphingobacterium daejeonense]VTQ04816.1 Uncharacterised protein [Sphingobacterium daejeonense]